MAESGDFCERYRKSCLQDKLYPLRSVMRHVKGSELAIPIEVVRRDHWQHLFTCLNTDNSLTKVHFASCLSPENHDSTEELKRNKRDKGFPVPYARSENNISCICISISRLLLSSQKLMVLKLENLSLCCYDAKQLSIGLSVSSHLKLLSLANCRLNQPLAFKIICDGICKSRITWLDLSCSFPQFNEMEHVVRIMKAHSRRRDDELFPSVLRFGFPNLDESHGINRISFNFNYLSPEAFSTLIECLKDDLYIKALDFQNCGIDNEKAEILLELATMHPAIEIIDLRSNSSIDKSLLDKIEQQLCMRKVGKTPTYTYSPLWKPSEILKGVDPSRKGKLQKTTSKYRFRTSMKTSKSLNHSTTKVPSVIPTKVTKMEDASVQTPFDTRNVLPENVQQLIQSLRMAVHNEKKNRHFHEAKCRKLEKENVCLRNYLANQNDDIYIDQETFLEIKSTFEKLKIFFDVMKKYGLWEYISMLGFDEYIDVIVKKNESLNCVTVLKKDSSASKDAEMNDAPIYVPTPKDLLRIAKQYRDALSEEEKESEEPCCDCRKIDSRHTHKESPVQPENIQTRVKSHVEDKVKKTEVPTNLKLAHKFLQEYINEYMNDYKHVSQDTVKRIRGKLFVPLSAKGAFLPNILMKTFSYANMPEHVKKLVSPKEFYTILKGELERCVMEMEASKPLQSTDKLVHNCAECRNKNSLVPETNVVKPPPNSAKCRNKSLYVPEIVSREPNSAKCRNKSLYVPEIVSREKPVPNSAKLNAIRQRMKRSLIMPSESSEEELDEDMTIHEILLKKKNLFPGYSNSTSSEKSTKYIPTPSSSKSTNHAKIQETKSLTKSEQTLPKSKQKHFNSSQTSIKREDFETHFEIDIPSDEDSNPFDSITTTSETASSSSSSKPHVKKPSSSPKKSNHQKSYIESVSDASTFKDVESISDVEVSVQDLSQSKEVKKFSSSKTKSVSSVATSKGGSASSQSSTLRNTLKSKQNKADKDNKSGPSSMKSASNKSDKLTNCSSHPQAKTKTSNKQGIKNRPKSNSSKGSSIPSLSDITTVSSKSLNTASMMKQITGSEDKSKVSN